MGKYLHKDDHLMAWDKEAIIKYYLPYLKKINADFDERWITNSWVFKSNYAQPVFEVNHSRNVPSMVVVPGKIYWASMDHVYPWDRGTNFAVSWGKKVARLMIDNR